MGKSSQRKGVQGEVELCKLLQDNGYSVQRGGSMTFGAKPDLYGLPGIHVEVKRVQRLNIHEAIRQAQRDAERFKDGSPTVFHRMNREQWLVTMPFTDWIELYRSKNENSI